MQATKGAWLWKLEALLHSGQGKRFTAFTGGFEYTFGNVRRSGIDLGLLAEYLYDERGTGATPFVDDLFVGARVALNDIQDTQMLAGTIIDRSSQARITRLEATRRLGDTFKLDVEMLDFAGAKNNDPFYSLRQDDHLRLILARYF